MYTEYLYNNSLAHHGIKGQRWGIRRFQNEDGSLTSEGKIRYYDSSYKSKEIKNKDSQNNTFNEISNDKKKELTDKQKKLIRNVAIGAIVAGSILAVYGAYKYSSGPTRKHTWKVINDSIMDIKDLPADSLTIKEGKNIYRMAGIKETLSDSPIYASHTKHDRRAYKNIMQKHYNADYEMVGKASKDIKIAGQRDAAEAYLKATGKNKLVNYEFNNFNTGLIDRSKPENIRFFKELEKAGFGGVIDINDVGTYADSPIILLNPKENIKNLDIHKIRYGEAIINALLMR